MKTEALAVRSRFRRETETILRRAARLNSRGMSAEVERIASARGVPFDSIHPFPFGRFYTPPIAEESDFRLRMLRERKGRL